MEINVAKNKELFEGLLKKYVKREGLDKLMSWLEKTDFYTAPATTKHVLAVEGGLCQHTLNVLARMVVLLHSHYGFDIEQIDESLVYNGVSVDQMGAFDIESVVIVALLHTLHKAECYVKDFKNVKVNGKWVQEEYWKWDERFVYGRGSKSVYVIQQFMRLYIDEALAIRYYTAGVDSPFSAVYDTAYMRVYESNRLAVFLNLASNYAMWIDDNDLESVSALSNKELLEAMSIEEEKKDEADV